MQAVKRGAVEFLTKPFNAEVLLTAIQRALKRSRHALAHKVELQELRDRYATLTPREEQVMALVVSGLLNKQVGGELGISKKTVKAHRGGDAENEGQLCSRSGENGRETPPHSFAVESSKSFGELRRTTSPCS